MFIIFENRTLNFAMRFNIKGNPRAYLSYFTSYILKCDIEMQNE